MKTFPCQYPLHFVILLSSLILFTLCQSQCHLKRFPQVIPMLYGQQTTINLQQYVTGSNITFTVQPNDFFANIQPQYSCKWIWSHQLGRIIATDEYEIRQNNKTEQLVAMLGGSAYFTDVYLVYYGVNVTDFQLEVQGKGNRTQDQSSNPFNLSSLSTDNLLVLQVPRHKLKDCRNFNILSNNTHLQIILDCLSLSNQYNKILSTTVIPINTPIPNPQWTHIQSPIYLPKQIIPKLQNIRSQTAVIDTYKSYRYLVRTVMSEYQDYIQVWRWTTDSKQIIGVYDRLYFIDQDNFFGDDIDIRMIQVVSNTLLVLDLLNGIHVLRMNKLGHLVYKTNIQIQAFTMFHYDPKQQLLFMGKQGQIQQYEIQLYSQTNIKANRIQRYHLFDFEEISQITTQNRFLYVSTQKYIHVIHLTNIPTNDQDYDGSYKIYPELYVQRLIPTVSGFIKVIGYEANVQISVCETHPPFLHLKTPKLSNNFTIHAISTINDRSTQCSLPVTSVLVTAQDDKIYLNGYEAENETIFSNRPGTTVIELEKYGIGKNIDYELLTFNHQIPFTHKFRKTNPMGCQFVKNTSVAKDMVAFKPSQQKIEPTLEATPITKTSSVGNWLIVQYPQKRVKQYYKCSRYQKISCKLTHLSIVPTNTPISAYQLIQQQRTKKEYLHEAMSYQLGNQTIIEVTLISGTPKNQTNSSEQYSKDNLQTSSLLCKIKYPSGSQYQISQFQLRQDKLYVVLPHMKQIRVYEGLLSFQQDFKCRQLGSINVTSFKHPSIFFSPQHIDFNKQSLYIPYAVPSSSLSRNHNLQITSQIVDQMFVSQWSQILVIRLTIGTSSITKIEFLKSIIIDRFRESADANLIVTLPYVLAIDKQQKIIAQYYFTHTFDAYFIRMLDFWWDNSTSASAYSNTNVRLVDSNTLAVMTTPDAENQTYAQIYILNSIVSSFKQFAKWKVSSTFHVMTFVEDEYEFMTVNIEQTTTSLQMLCNSTTLTPSPYLSIEVPKKTKIDQPSKEQFYLRLSTLDQSKRFVLGLQVASDSLDILKGEGYPYKTLRLKLEEDQDFMYVELNDSKWFKGNIWNQRYVCNDCNTGRIKFEDKISLVSKIQLQSFNIPKDFYVHQRKNEDGLGQYSFQIIEGYLLTKLTPQSQNNTWLYNIMPQFPFSTNTISSLPSQPNTTYTFSQSFILTSNTQKDPSCIKTSPTEHDLYFASLCDDYQYLDESASLQLKLYSNTGFKPFIISEYYIQLKLFKSSLNRIKAGTKSSKQLIILSPPNDLESSSPKYDTLFVRFDDNIWVFLVVNGKLELIYTVDKVDFGDDHLCWMEVITKTVNVEVTRTELQYGIVASMCQTGLYYIVFTVDPPKSTGLTTQKQPIPSFHRISQQHIDLQTQLQKNKIQLPQHSYFLQTIIKPIINQPRSYYLYTIVQNFNSFIWKITILRQTIAISGMQFIGVIRRYNEYSPIQVTSNDQRYFTVLYKSVENANVSQFLAVYDGENYVLNKEKDIREYNMFSVQVTSKEPVYQNKSEVFQIGNSLFLLNKNQIKQLNVTNLIRLHVQKNYPQVNEIIKEMEGQSEGGKEEEQLENQLQPKPFPQNLLSQSQQPILYSQSIIIFVQTPTQVNSVTIKLDSIDFFQLSGWQITFIIFGSFIALIILYYISKQLWKYIQKRRKLVRLQTDVIDDKSSEKVSSQRHSQQDRENEIRSDGSEEEQQPRRNIHGRDTLITTSDSHSILERKGLEQSLLQEEEE